MAVEAQLAANRRIMAAFKARDAAGMAEGYTEDCSFILGGNNTIIRGRKELVPAFEAMFEKYSALLFEATEQTVLENQITEVGKFHLKLNNSEEEKVGWYVSLTVKKNGRWLVHYDMIGSDQ